MDRFNYVLRLFILGLLAYVLLPVSSVFVSIIIGALIFALLLRVSYTRALHIGIPDNAAKLLTALMLFPVATLIVVLLLIFGRRINVG